MHVRAKLANSAKEGVVDSFMGVKQADSGAVANVRMQTTHIPRKGRPSFNVRMQTTHIPRKGRPSAN
ncbi:hypothetical protein, partial [Cohnella sp. REN36]|uniref:hypothetical protein n=1 Tax=Cohnella sp. REN36 TaxID=2887347 RepID=UPI001D154583